MFLEDILRDGLRPVQMGGVWRLQWPVRPGYVHLTDVNFLHYANVAHMLGGYQHDLIGVEIDASQLERDRLNPDDEYLAYLRGLRGSQTKNHGRIPELDPQPHQMLWHHSLENLGTLSYMGPIPRKAISRVIRIDRLAFTKGEYVAWNKRVSIVERKQNANLHRLLTQHCFGDSPILPLYEECLKQRSVFGPGVTDEFIEQQVGKLDRGGYIEVVLDQRPEAVTK